MRCCSLLVILNHGWLILGLLMCILTTPTWMKVATHHADVIKGDSTQELRGHAFQSNNVHGHFQPTPKNCTTFTIKCITLISHGHFQPRPKNYTKTALKSHFFCFFTPKCSWPLSSTDQMHTFIAKIKLVAEVVYAEVYLDIPSLYVEQVKVRITGQHWALIEVSDSNHGVICLMVNNCILFVLPKHSHRFQPLSWERPYL